MLLPEAWRRAAEQRDARAIERLSPHDGTTTEPLELLLETATSHGHGDVVNGSRPARDDERTLSSLASLFYLSGLKGHTSVMWRLFKQMVTQQQVSKEDQDAALTAVEKPGDALRRSLFQPDETQLRSQCARMLRAAREGNVVVLREMIQQHAMCVHCVDDATGETAFSAAFACGRRNVCELLLQCGAVPVGVCTTTSEDVTVVTGTNKPQMSCSLVRRAVEERNAVLVEWLLESGASAHTPAVDGDKSALAIAAYHGDKEIVGILLTHGVKLHETQCRWMALPDKWPIETWNLTGQGLTVLSDPTSFLLLAIACFVQNPRFAKYLLATRPDLQDRELMGRFGTLALALAIHRKQDDMALDLVARGATTSGSLIRFAVVEADSVHLLRLFRAEASESQSRVTEQLLFVRAAQLGSMGCVEEMIKSGITRTTDAPRNLGACAIRAFEYAIKNGLVEGALLLMGEFQVPLSVASMSRCFGYAIDDQNSELLEILLAHPAATPGVVQAAFKEACMRGLCESAGVLLAYGVDVNVPICNGTTFLLHQVVSKLGQGEGYTLTAKLLLDAGASIDVVDAFGETVLGALERRRSQIKTSTGMIQLHYIEALLRERGVNFWPHPTRRDGVQVPSFNSDTQRW